MKKLYLALFSFTTMGITNAQVSSFPFTEDFESFATCTASCNSACALGNGWSNEQGGADAGEWITDNGGTSSSSTGPSVDFNPGTSTGNYLYFETSSPCYSNVSAMLYTPTFDLTANSAFNMIFAYHMYGATQGTMAVDVSTDGGATWTGSPLWSQSGDHGDVWIQDTVDLSAYIGNSAVIVRITGTSTTSFTSDMAVDDFIFYEPLPNDAGISKFYSPTFPACNPNSDVWVELKNYGYDTLVSANIDWKINGNALPSQAWSGALAPGAIDSVNLGTITIADGDVLQAYTSMPNALAEQPGGAGNDTTNLTVGFGLSGVYTIDPAGNGDYIDFTSAVADIESFGVCGSVIFDVLDGTYNEQIMLNAYPGQGVTGDVTFRGANGASSAVQITYASTTTTDNYIFQFNGAENVTLRNIQMFNTGATYSHVIEFANNTNYVTIDSCNLSSNQTTSTSTNYAVVYSNSSTYDNYIHFTNSTIENGSYSFYFYGGTSTSNLSDGFVVENCTLQNFYYRGIQSYYNENAVIRNNTVSNDGVYTGSVYLIYMYYNGGSSEVSGNYLQHKLPAYGYGIYLSNCTSEALNRGKIFNNAISIGNPATTSTSYGIYSTSSSNFDILNNSFYMSSNGTSSRGIYMTSGVGNDIMNNNIVNDGPGYGIYLVSGFDNVDYNNIYAPNGNFGYFGAAQATLADWQSATALDLNSYSVDPMFPTFTDLTTCNDTLDNVAMQDSAVMYDITGLIRNSTPDIGAFEFEGVMRFNLGSDTSICGTDFITLGSSTSPSSWSWSSGDTTNTIDVYGVNSGSYIATRTSSCGTAIDTIVITQSPDPVAVIDTNQVSYATVVFGNNSTDATTYAWDFGDGNTSNEATPFHIYTNGGSYTVILSATGPCGTDVDTMVINLSITGIDQLSANIDMYPNPTNEMLNIVADQNLNADIVITNIEGRIVKSTRMTGTTLKLNVSDLAKGMYMVKITNEEGSSIQRLIVE